jgi:uncharacterized membrane protein YfcA
MVAAPALAAEGGTAPGPPLWLWPLAVFVLTTLIGFLGVLGGVGGGVLFVPIAAGIFPFHIDFIRATGLLVALCGSLSAGPHLLRDGFANFRLVIPAALVASAAAIAGAVIGLVLPVGVIKISLAITILGIATLMLLARRSEHPGVEVADPISRALHIHGMYHDPSLGEDQVWRIHRTPLGWTLFAGAGLIGGMFGLGAGWANVAIFNLVMGAPLKVSVASSHFLISITGTSASWVYISRGCVLPLIVTPAVVGAMLGSRMGVLALREVKPAWARRVVIGLMILAAVNLLW